MTKKYWCPTCGDLVEVPSIFPWTEGKMWKHARVNALQAAPEK